MGGGGGERDDTISLIIMMNSNSINYIWEFLIEQSLA